ncbi:hypothetical protein Hypma_011071 [Hypsizygus marmoreus]|uniref:Uncharacterized protein n=1 Tax=Hypsizygus marmoreus TaxID=39966 RepID=A0A369JKU1_HYPMA|nr:hypothetical protein Hypma_011071 [Hypsizygus marmoreus]
MGRILDHNYNEDQHHVDRVPALRGCEMGLHFLATLHLLLRLWEHFRSIPSIHWGTLSHLKLMQSGLKKRLGTRLAGCMSRIAEASLFYHYPSRCSYEALLRHI